MAKIINSGIITYPHGFSTRIGGISKGVFESLNLGINTDDNEMSVKRNWQIFLSECGIGTWDFVYGNQVHGNKVHIASAMDAKPAYGQDPCIEADGYVTAAPGVPLAIFAVDCIPLLLADEVNGVVGAIHCGWHGTVLDIEKNAIEAMKSLGANPRYIKASIGPAIGMCCFEVGEEVVEAAFQLLGGEHVALYKKSVNEGKYMLNLPGVLKVRLGQLGIPAGNIEEINMCTMCNQDLFWSHRGMKGTKGSQAAVIMIPKGPTAD